MKRMSATELEQAMAVDPAYWQSFFTQEGDVDQVLSPIPYDRSIELLRMIATGQPKPANLSADEDLSWQTMALQVADTVAAGEVVDFPSE